MIAVSSGWLAHASLQRCRAILLSMKVEIDDPRSLGAMQLLREHLKDVARHSPAESIHALDVDAMCRPEITFWTVRAAGEVIGCGALLELDPAHGEIKSMRTARTHQRQGVASVILETILEEARRRAYRRLSLETGAQDAFTPARALYQRFGFAMCDPFADYRPDPNSVFMTRCV